ncbi:MAG TPA: glycogen debranching N-terminal domain-containing protein [Actinokineospora sp.]|nr:glycogen debranching N-terminal domain-containing protein [Actinokineospora sp.]
MTAWNTSAGPPPSSAATTLVDGTTFCRSDTDGEIHPDQPHGLFVADTRVLSTLRITIDGHPVEPLGVTIDEPFAATFTGRARPRDGQADSTLLVVRRRVLGAGMTEDIVLRNLSGDQVDVAVGVVMGADFADLFEVKDRRAAAHPTSSVEVLAVVPARGQWSLRLNLNDADGPVSSPAGRLAAWRAMIPRITTADHGLAATLRTSATDLGALQIHGPTGERVVAAGAPWFMALFGRDSLLTSWMALPLDQGLALGTLRALAARQGTKVDPVTEEQPGRVPHEVRLGREAARHLGGGTAYYGTADATPLFVALLGELHRWGLPEAELTDLLPAADRALRWMADNGDPFIEYERATDNGLVNQGWKDSFDGVNHADGRLAVPPIALAEVQGYAYAAYTARARIATSLGDTATAADCTAKAERLKAAFNERFWLPDKGWFAIGLDADKRPIDALTSNIGHCLWSGIVADDKAAAVADALTGPRLWTGFGIRTLADDMGAYNPMSYHNGSVWPHDSAIAAAGLLRYGFVDQATMVAEGLLAAADHFGGRLPELFCGFDRAEFPAPVPYPTSCSPQAWSAAAPLLLLRTLLRLEPDLPSVRVDPVLPARMLPLRIEGLPVAGTRLTIEVEDGRRQLSRIRTDR